MHIRGYSTTEPTGTIFADMIDARCFGVTDDNHQTQLGFTENWGRAPQNSNVFREIGDNFYNMSKLSKP